MFLLLVRPLHQELVGPIPPVPACWSWKKLPLHRPLALPFGHGVPPATMEHRAQKGTTLLEVW